jgi:hypothetical protein
VDFAAEAIGELVRLFLRPVASAHCEQMNKIQKMGVFRDVVSFGDSTMVQKTRK